MNGQEANKQLIIEDCLTYLRTCILNTEDTSSLAPDYRAWAEAGFPGSRSPDENRICAYLDYSPQVPSEGQSCSTIFTFNGLRITSRRKLLLDCFSNGVGVITLQDPESGSTKLVGVIKLNNYDSWDFTLVGAYRNIIHGSYRNPAKWLTDSELIAHLFD